MRKRLISFAGIVLFFGLFCSLSVQGGKVEAKEIKWGCYTDLTGPIAVTSNNAWDAFQAYHEWMKKFDPIPGITIKLIWQDTGYSAPKYLSAFKKFKSNGMSIAYSMSSTASVTIGPLHKKTRYL